MDAFQKAIQIKPEDAECHFMLGKLYAQQENFQASKRENLILQKLDPKLAQNLSRYINKWPGGRSRAGKWRHSRVRRRIATD
jgi:hypothetical protein